MGQLRSRSCPVCDAANDGKWTCPRCAPLLPIYRELLRNLQSWRASYEQGDVGDILSHGGQDFSLWDLTAFYDSRDKLAPRQALAIELCLYDNLAEHEAAEKMGISSRSPVSIYATVGIARLLGLAYQGAIPGFRPELPERKAS